MDQKIIFRELLSELCQKAGEQGNRISREAVEAFFEHAKLNAEQIGMIVSYLEEQRIEVYREAVAGEAQEEETRSWMEGFLEELEQVRAPEADAELELFYRAAAKDHKAREQLATLYLQTVCSLAAEYEEETLPAEDLLQEGSVGLLLALDALPAMDSLAAYRTRLFNEVNRYLQETIQRHRRMDDAGGAALRKVQRLDEAMQSLMEDFGRKVTVEELSAFLEMPAEEIRDIARLAGNELEFGDSTELPKMPWEL